MEVGGGACLQMLAWVSWHCLDPSPPCRQSRSILTCPPSSLHPRPVIETLLLLDRYLLLLTSLPPPSATQPRLTISLKPIFDPATGSLRNMALIVSPAPMPTA